MLNPSVKYAVVPGFPRYIVGADDTLWSNIIPGHKPEKGFVHWHEIFPASDDRGYKIITLSQENGPRTSMYMHAIVLKSFVGPCPDGMQCRHLNGNKQDCTLGNLAWGTPKENGADKLIHLTHAFGERNAGAKLTAEQVQQIRQLHAKGTSANNLALQFQVGKTTIWRVIKRTHWTRVED